MSRSLKFDNDRFRDHQILCLVRSACDMHPPHSHDLCIFAIISNNSKQVHRKRSDFLLQDAAIARFLWASLSAHCTAANDLKNLTDIPQFRSKRRSNDPLKFFLQHCRGKVALTDACQDVRVCHTVINHSSGVRLVFQALSIWQDFGLPETSKAQKRSVRIKQLVCDAKSTTSCLLPSSFLGGFMQFMDIGVAIILVKPTVGKQRMRREAGWADKLAGAIHAKNEMQSYKQIPSKQGWAEQGFSPHTMGFLGCRRGGKLCLRATLD